MLPFNYFALVIYAQINFILLLLIFYYIIISNNN